MFDLNEKGFENRMRRLGESIAKANAQTARLREMKRQHFEEIRLQRQIAAVSRAAAERVSNG